MAVTMELEESASDSKLHRDSTAKKELRPSSAVSFSKSEHGPGLSRTHTRYLVKCPVYAEHVMCNVMLFYLFDRNIIIIRAIKTV